MDAIKVGCGAGLGAVARYLLSTALGGGPWILLLINVVGSGAMGYARPGLFWGTGVLGGFTSFAAFALVTSEMSPAQAGLYVAATLVGCVGAWHLGNARRPA